MQPRALLFELMSGRARWLAERQAVLGRNVANADTPGFRPVDLEPAGFAELLARGRRRTLEPARTAAAHLALAPKDRGSFRTQDASGPETAPSGNAVSLPIELQKMSTTELDHQLTTQLYRRYLALLRTAIGAPQG